MISPPHTHVLPPSRRTRLKPASCRECCEWYRRTAVEPDRFSAAPVCHVKGFSAEQVKSATDLLLLLLLLIEHLLLFGDVESEVKTLYFAMFVSD